MINLFDERAQILSVEKEDLAVGVDTLTICIIAGVVVACWPSSTGG